MLTILSVRPLTRRVALLATALLVSMGLAGSADAQTATSTSTPTVTATATATPTLAIPKTPGSSDSNAYKYGSIRVATPVCPTPSTQSIIIPGLKQGDLIQLYPSNTYTGGASWSITTNNTLRLNTGSCLAAGGIDWSYVWFSRAQNNCQGAPNCGAAATVTATPTVTPTP